MTEHVKRYTARDVPEGIREAADGESAPEGQEPQSPEHDLVRSAIPAREDALDGEQQLRRFAHTLRHALEPGLPRDPLGRAFSAGACLHACVLVVATMRRFKLVAQVHVRGGAGELGQGAKDANGVWNGHYWVEVTTRQCRRLVIDITADQFGFEPIRILPVEQASAWYRPGDQTMVDVSLKELADTLGCVDLLSV